MPSVAALAGEGAELRGLKQPSLTIGLDDESGRSESGTVEGLKWGNVDALDHLAPRLSLYGGTLEAQQFTSNNLRFSSARHRPLGQLSPGAAERLRHPVYDPLPKYTLYNNVTRMLPGGWGLGIGLRQSEYHFGNVNLLSLSAERYFGSFRGAYTLYSSRAEGGALGSAQRVQMDYLYGERNTVGLSYTMGRDIEQLGLGAGMQLNDVRDLTLSGRHWLTPNWAVTYDLLSQEQSNLLKRQGLRLGVSRTF
jgi:YaiO family outer membrane protein